MPTLSTDAVNWIFVAAVVAVVAAFDVWRLLAGGGDATISSTVYRAGKALPWLAWATLAGLAYLWLHLFWGW